MNNNQTNMNKIVVDEADKAPLEVVAILKGLGIYIFHLFFFFF